MSDIDTILQWLKDRTSVSFKTLAGAVLGVLQSLIHLLPENPPSFMPKAVLPDEELASKLLLIKEGFIEKGSLPPWLYSIIMTLLQLLLKA